MINQDCHHSHLALPRHLNSSAVCQQSDLSTHANCQRFDWILRSEIRQEIIAFQDLPFRELLWQNYFNILISPHLPRPSAY